jgi:hypothetical protein
MKAGVASRLDMSRLGPTRRERVRIPMLFRVRASGINPFSTKVRCSRVSCAELPEATVLPAVLDGA